MNETTQFANGGINTGLTLVTEFIVLIGLGLLLLIIEPKGALVVIGVLLMASLLYYILSKKYILRLGEKRQLHEGHRIQHIQQGLGGIKDIKLLGKEISFLQQYAIHNEKYANSAQKQSFLFNIPRLVLDLLAISSLTILVLSMLSDGKTIKDMIPTLAVFAAAALRLMASINRILGNWQTFQYTIPVIKILSKELNLNCNSIKQKNNKKIDFSDRITLKKVSFRYPQTKEPSLNNINIDIKKGLTVVFIGSSGAGKSTLLDLMGNILNYMLKIVVITWG